MQRGFLVSVLVVALLACALPAQAQGGSHAIPCNLDVTLNIGRVFHANLYLQVVLVLDTAASTTTVSYYDVRGGGSYVAAGESGRIVLMDGRYSSLSADYNRFVEVRFVSGALRGTTYILKIVGVTSGVAKGSWLDPADPIVNGNLTGTTDC